jgi:hypothetical protein
VLTNINVHNIIAEKLPRQCDVVCTFWRRSENEFTNLLIFKHLNCFKRIEIFELRVVNSPLLIPALWCTFLVYLESRINQVFFPNIN